MLMNPSKILWQQKKKQANELIFACPRVITSEYAVFCKAFY